MFRFREIKEVKEDKNERNLPYIMSNDSNGTTDYEFLARKYGVNLLEILDLPFFVDVNNEEEVREYLYKCAR
jgi:ABC-type Zn uptake system ZnuABC Zn-binding protein ZnuA